MVRDFKWRAEENESECKHVWMRVTRLKDHLSDPPCAVLREEKILLI